MDALETNYLEFVLVDNACGIENDLNYLVSLCSSDYQIGKLIDYLTLKNIKSHEKRIKKYVKNTLIYEVALEDNGNVTDIKCYNKTILNVSKNSPNVYLLEYNKTKVPIHSFSASIEIHDVEYIKRLTYRFSNRIYINIDSIKNFDGSKYSKVFVNVNIDKNVDKNFVFAETDQLMSQLLMSLRK